VVLPEEELPSPKPIDYSARTWSVEKLAQFCCARQVNDRDFTIVATGTKGAGKSTLMYKLAKRIGEINGAGFSLQKNILISSNAIELAKQIDEAPKRSALVIDEAIGALYSEEWADKEQKGFHKYVNQLQRKDLQAIVLLCIPSIWDLRGPYLRGVVDCWIHLIAPGTGAIMIRSPAPVQDCFFRYELIELWKRVAKSENRMRAVAQYDTDFQRQVYSKMPTFKSFIEFDALVDDEYQRYLLYWREHREEIRTSLFEKAKAEQMKREMLVARYAKFKKFEGKDESESDEPNE
jgi:GTPase SAR1 family protein